MGNSNIEIRPAGGEWDAFPTKPPTSEWDAFPDKPAIDYGGMAQQAGVGVAKGAIGLPGMIGDAQELFKKGVDYVASKLPAPSEPDAATRKFMEKYGDRGDMGPSFPLPTSHDIQGQVEKVTGPFRQPKNQMEADAQTAGEFLPAALLGPGSFLRKAVTQEAIPAAATIVAGRYSDQNPYVKALAGFLTGAAGGFVRGPNSAEKLIRDKIPASVTEQDITRAGQLIEHAQARGVTLAWPEALSRVTGQAILTDTMRVLESHPQTAPRMNEFFADRPAQIEGATRHELDYLATPHPNPDSIGPAAAQAATQTATDVRAAINRATRPSYDAAAQTLVPQAVHAQAMADPLFARTLDQVRNNPELSAQLHAHSDRSVAVYDAVKQQLEQRSRNLAQPTNPDASQLGAYNTGSLATEVRGAALDASRNATHGPSHYERALGEQTRLREQYLNPLLEGSLGRLANAKDTEAAINALFPRTPLEGSAGDISRTVTAVAARRPAIAEQLVRAHIGMVFAESARALQGGASQFAGAKFFKELVGNAEQRANLQAAIEALPNGRNRWEGLNQLLDIAAATGTRQPKGSLTAFNEIAVNSMSSSGLAALAAKGASPGTYWTAATKAFQAWSLGRNLDSLAAILTNPGSGDALRQIVRIPPGTDRAVLAAGRLINQLGASTTEQRSKPNH